MNFCTLIPPYPKKAYIVSIFLSFQDKLTVFTFSLLQTTLAEITEDVTKIDAAVKKYSKHHFTVLDSCSILPVTFSSRLLLQKKYWEHPTLEYTPEKRQQMFVPLLDNPQLYTLLVVPQHHDEKKDIWQFFAAIPFFLNTPKSTIEQFMNTSNTPVDPRAKYAALYTFGHAIRFDWRTGKRTKLLTSSRENTAN